MEKLPFLRSTEKQFDGDFVTDTVICEKAWVIYTDLLQQSSATSAQEKFEDSQGWLKNFQKKINIHSVVRYDKTVSFDFKATEEFIKTFAQTFAKGCICQQVFNSDETGLFWKKMTRQTYIMAEEKRYHVTSPWKIGWLSYCVQMQMETAGSNHCSYITQKTPEPLRS